jgi:hypothetical protein
MPPLPFPRGHYGQSKQSAWSRAHELRRLHKQQRSLDTSATARRVSRPARIVMPDQPAEAMQFDVNALRLVGIYIERVAVQRAELTVWEGAHLGPARGLNIAVDMFYFSVQLCDEPCWLRAPETAPVLMRDESKIVFPITFSRSVAMSDMSQQQQQQQAQQEKEQQPQASPTDGGAASPPAQNMDWALVQWSLTNAALRLGGVESQLVYNEKWLQTFAQKPPPDLSTGDRVVVNCYENERLVRGASAHVPPTHARAHATRH